MTEGGIVDGGGEAAEESQDDSAGEETNGSQVGIVTTNGGDLNVRTGAGTVSYTHLLGSAIEAGGLSAD